VTPSGGFTGSVALTAAIAGSPEGAQYPPTLSFGSTSPVVITGASPGTALLTVTTTTPPSGSALAYPKSRRGRWQSAVGAALACVLIFCIPARSRRSQSMLRMLLLLFTLSVGVLSCGGSGQTTGTGGSGGGGSAGTTAGTYTVTVTGTSGTTTATGTVTILVQ
jgi:hypothetical protein